MEAAMTALQSLDNKFCERNAAVAMEAALEIQVCEALVEVARYAPGKFPNNI
jgi:hypothetical protein